MMQPFGRVSFTRLGGRRSAGYDPTMRTLFGAAGPEVVPPPEPPVPPIQPCVLTATESNHVFMFRPRLDG